MRARLQPFRRLNGPLLASLAALYVCYRLLGGPADRNSAARKHSEQRQEDADDPIVSQLHLSATAPAKTFKIYKARQDLQPGKGEFVRQQCRVDRCEIVAEAEEADALIFENSEVRLEPSQLARRRPQQLWIAQLLESPVNTFDPRFERRWRGKHLFNWTAAYRLDSDIVTPYSKFVLHHQTVAAQDLARAALESSYADKQSLYQAAPDAHKRLVSGKRAQVAWLVSNCNAHNGRLEYARELAKHIQVDVYGKCGQLECPKSNQSACLAMINSNYKFYLAFENSNCAEYITEKFYRNALGYNDLSHLVVPIVMGAPRAHYERLAPPNSFIHVHDFASPLDLANYLKLLDSDDALYYSYFRWKSLGSFIDTKFMCRLCALLHRAHLETWPSKHYADIKTWWNFYTLPNGSLTSSCES